jgi:hypothetical protein
LNILGRAGNNLTINAGEISTAGGGSIHLHAGHDLSVIDGAVQLARVNTALAGGDISLTAVNDVVVPSPFGRLSDGNVSLPGLHVGLPGNLTIRAGNDFRGPVTTRNPRGPGFTLQGGTADVAAGRDIGTEQAPVSLILGGRIDNGDGTYTVPASNVNLSAGRSLFFSLAEDFGLRESGFLTANSSLNLTARTSDILIQPGTPTGQFAEARRIFPANFSAQADEGSIVLVTETKPLSFWPSPTGKISFQAKHEIKGQGKLQLLPDDNSVLIFVGLPGDQASRWVRVSRQQAENDPLLGVWLQRYGDLSYINGQPPDGFPSGASEPPALLREKPLIEQRPNTPAVVSLNPGDIGALVGFDVAESEISRALKQPSTQVSADVAPVRFATESGDIVGMQLSFLSPSFLKQITFESGKDIKGVLAEFSAPQLPTGQPAVRIHAKGSIDLKKTQGFTTSGMTFVGNGTAEVRANGNIDLGDSFGIVHRLGTTAATLNQRKQGGLLDIGAGGNIDMTQSQIATFNGGSIFIHGADGVRILDSTGRPITGAVETKALLLNQSGTMVLALPDQNGTPVPIQAYKATLPVDQTNPSQGVFTVQDVKNGQVELVWKPLYVEQTGQMFLVGGERVKQGDQTVFNQKVVLVDLNPARAADGKAILSDGRPALVDGRLMLEVSGQQVSLVSPVGGKVNIGGNSTNKSEQTGIATLRGGDITILSTGNVDVNRSRVGTFDSGNIVIKSTSGTINAGSGSKDERTTFVIDNGDGTRTLATVPGSGIFTWERDDPDFTTLPFPKFNTPQMDALYAKIIKRRFLGRDASDLEAAFNLLSEQRKDTYGAEYDNFIEHPFGPGSRALELGDISLIAARNIDVPQAGIRGRRINLEAGESLNLLGGSIIGKTTFSAASVTGSLGAFAGAAAGSVGGASVSAAGGAGGSSVGGLSGATSTVSASASSTSSTTSTATKAVEEMQQVAADAVAANLPKGSKQVASSTDGNEKKSQLAQSVRMKRGVVIQVDVKPETKPGS